MTTSPIEAAECDSCTVATDNHSGLCDFCAEYNPPTAAQLAQMMSDSAHHAHMATEDLEDTLARMPEGVPLFAVLDLVSAKRHLGQAIRLINRATEATR